MNQDLLPSESSETKESSYYDFIEKEKTFVKNKHPKCLVHLITENAIEKKKLIFQETIPHKRLQK